MFSSTELQLLHVAARDTLITTKPELLEKLICLIRETSDAERKQAEEERQKRAALPKLVPDFSGVRPGTAVVRSEEWKKQQAPFGPGAEFGLVTRVRRFPDVLCGKIAYPMVHWVGGSDAVLCSPDTVALRDGTPLPMVTMNANSTGQLMGEYVE